VVFTKIARSKKRKKVGLRAFKEISPAQGLYISSAMRVETTEGVLYEKA
jgi:hypothetical protein